MKINLDSQDQEIRIEIVPLIDVIFCILTFFILAAIGLTRQQAIGVDLPQASTGQTQMRKLAMVTLSPSGQLYFQQSPVTKDMLIVQLQAFKQAQPDGMIVLYASQSAFYSNVVAVLDLLRSVGGDRVALATLPSGANPAQDSPDQFNPLDSGSGFPSNSLPNNGLPNNGLPNNSFPSNGFPGSDPGGGVNPGLGNPGTGNPNQPYQIPGQAPAPNSSGDRAPAVP
ncbi:MAG: biopolymer transporter ExbD [Oscillatoriales cyanobacterium]|nr:MAG: biopolymer transporter ExbD [Oscillatoriales cyanobacterium]